MDAHHMHLLAATALQSALERVHGNLEILDMALADCLHVSPAALGTPPALPSVHRWLKAEKAATVAGIAQAAEMKQKVLTYIEML